MNTPNNKRRRESQNRMETAFIRLLQNAELSQVTVTDICKEAGVNRTTFYANYQDVYALGEAVQKRLLEEVLSLYRDEQQLPTPSHNFLKLFQHIRDNQLFYNTYFKLCRDGELQIFGYHEGDAAAYYNGKHIDYHIEFFGHGLNAIIKKWLRGGCQESPEEMCEILESEYAK